MERRMNKAGFSLIEMLLVIGILAALMGIAVVGFGGMSRRAQRTNTVELVSNAATALTMIFNESKAWSKPLIDGMSSHKLDRNTCAAFVRHGSGLLGLSYTKVMTEDGHERREVDPQSVDRFGLIDAYAQAVVRKRADATLGTTVPTGGTINDHILHYAIDDDGDGFVEVPLESGNVKVRATACVWSSGADGKFNKSRSKGDDVFSWRLEQEVR